MFERYSNLLKNAKKQTAKIADCITSAKYKEKGEEELDDMFLKEQSFSSFFEFYLLDFAAMFRAIELGLIKFKVSDFFKNYKIRKPG